MQGQLFHLPNALSPAKLLDGGVNEKNYYQQWATNSLHKTAKWTGWIPGHYNQMVWNTRKRSVARPALRLCRRIAHLTTTCEWYIWTADTPHQATSHTRSHIRINSIIHIFYYKEFKCIILHKIKDTFYRRYTIKLVIQLINADIKT
jgi:hypothetical protein